MEEQKIEAIPNTNSEKTLENPSLPHPTPSDAATGTTSHTAGSTTSPLFAGTTTLSAPPHCLSAGTTKSLLSFSTCVSDVTRLKRELPPAHYRIKIESFSLLADMLSKPGFEKHVSGAFEAGGYTWCLSLYPNGDKNRNGSDHISLYLVLSDTNALPPDREVNAFFKLFVYDQIRDKYLTVQDMESKRFHAMKSEWGFPQLLPLSTFKDATNGYLVGDCCIFGAEVFVTNGKGKGEIFSIIKEPQITFEWKIDNFSKIVEEFITSQVFTVGERKWRLLLHPKGVPAQKGKFMSVFLRPDDNPALRHGQNVYGAYKLRVKDQLHGSYVEKKVDCTLFSSSVPDWGFYEIMSLADLNNASKGFIVDDSVIVEVQIDLLSVVKDLA